MNPLIIIAGPTAVGKSALAVQLAKRINGSVISADSMQVYKGMDIGTAKVTPDEMQGIPHYLIDVLEPSESFNVVKFKEMAEDAIGAIKRSGRIPIMVGGTGFYIQSVLYDIDFDEYDLLVLPGGVRGTNNLNACEALKKQIVRFNDQGKGIAAICAAPTVFAGLGILNGKTSTCNPGFWEELRANGANVIEDSKVVVNGNIITSQAMGTSVDFGLALVGFLCGEEEKEALRTNIRFGAI